MKKIVIGLVGEMGAGKDTIIEHIKENFKDVVSLKFSTPLNETLKIFFDEIKREDQQWLVNGLRERFGQDILARAIAKKIRSIDGGIILLNGIRVWDDYDVIKEIEGAHIIYVTANDKIRWERMSKRGEKADDKCTWEEFLKKHKNATEISIAKIGEKADFKIENNGTLKELYEKTDKLIEKLK